MVMYIVNIKATLNYKSIILLRTDILFDKILVVLNLIFILE